MRSTTPAQRKAAALKNAERIRRSTSSGAKMILPASGRVDYFGTTPHYANSALPVVYDPVTGAVVTTSKGIRKFVDGLPGLGPDHKNSAGQYIPVATPIDLVANPVCDNTVNPPVCVPNDGDYYEIGVVDYKQQMHSDLPLGGTQLRGYVDLNPNRNPLYASDGNPHYLGPVIVARRDRPVRVKFFNNLLPTSNLFLPNDMTYMGAGMGPQGMYSENRATLHLHGGLTPWISDGTPHQWVVPKNDAGNYKKGASTVDVPDMPKTKDGEMTFFWSNQQSGRLMFYHDHSYGITRLNVYAGEAAGYLLYDQYEDDMITAGSLPDNGGGVYRWGVPLVIQDKTFVPPTNQKNVQDPTWNWGPEGNLWFPHVYMPNQNPNDDSGANAMGRWDYGPWFWPPMLKGTLTNSPITCGTGISAAYTGATSVSNPQCPATPNPSGVPEAFTDTPVVNGVAYPVMEVAKSVYRLRILNAANDRHWNLGLYYAVDANNNPCTTESQTGCTEVKMVDAIPHSASSVPPICAASGANPDVTVDPAGLSVANPNAADYNANTGMPGKTAACWPSSWPTDGRDGGVPDPTTAGPPLIQIGTEGGFLPNPVVIPSTPTGFNYNRRDIVVLNVANHGLFLGPAERADVIVDFRNVPDGARLILYNDAPAPVPASDPRNDYYTGNPDQTDTGGAPSTLRGMGPNTRTIMQIHVKGTAATNWKGLGTTGTAGTLAAELPKAFKATQPTLIVPEADYNTTYGINFSSAKGATNKNTYSRIQDTSMTFKGMTQAVAGVRIVNGGSGYTNTPPTVVFSGGGPGSGGASGTAVISGGKVTGVTMTTGGVGYLTQPIVTFVGGDGTGATGIVDLGAVTVDSQAKNWPMEPKTIQELFTTDYGRMNATLGVELPMTNFLTQTTIPLGYTDPATENMSDGQMQIWKVTHNGVDTHAIHFHLFNVQIINRVGWDGAIRPPDSNEIGWKETVRMNPLEDAIVAIRPMSMVLPSKIASVIPESVRPLDPTVTTAPSNAGDTCTAGSTGCLTLTNPADGNAINVPNKMTNFHWEYVWHCHLLGHEENDMMRPILFTVNPTAAGATITATKTGANQVTIAWSNLPVGTTGVTVQRAPAGGGFTTLASNLLVGATPYVDNAATSGSVFYYRVVTTPGSAPSNVVSVAIPLPAPNAPTVVSKTAGTTTGTVSLTWTIASKTGVIGYVVQRAPLANPTNWTSLPAITGANSTITVISNLPLGTYLFRVQATGGSAAVASPFSGTVQVALP